MSSTTICVTDTSVIPFPTLDSTYTQPSNPAPGPLPHKPHRNARASPPLSFSESDSSSSEPSDAINFAVQNRSASHARYDSSSSSSSSPSDDIRPMIIPRSKRVTSPHSTAIQDIFNPVTAASTPAKPKLDARSFTELEYRKQTPVRDPSDDEDERPFPRLRQPMFRKVGKLRLEGSAGKHVRVNSDSNVTASRASLSGTSSANPPPPQTIRKKSGQPIKSSLKNARRPDLHVVTNGPLAKSEPATPTQAKAVHFDSKLEHVKLFLAEQKPLAVSRDGSPTSDTSGDEFPSFIYGDDGRDNKHVKMLLPNMPSSPSRETNVALQGLVLSQDQRTITGNVRVRNIAYEKWLAIRFTFDWWQTTSEVTARYDKSIEDGAFDLFTFTIRLHDMWSRIEDKAIFIALRYTVAGQEYWDNNAGQNYHIKFVVDPLSEPSSAVDNDTGLKDLDSKLKDLARTRSPPIPITPYRLGRSFSADHQYASFAKPLSTRCDFASAYKTQWARTASPSASQHARTHTYPSGAPASAGPTVAPWSNTSETKVAEEIATPVPSRPALDHLGSPREVLDSTPTLPARPEPKPASPVSPTPSRLQDGRERNHRRGFIDRVVDGSPNFRRTPPGSPLKFDVSAKDAAVQLPRTRSFPLARPMGPSIPKPPLSIQITPVGDGGSEESTPYTASRSSSSSTSSGMPLLSPSSGSDTNYKQFLDQFCFYTGADHDASEAPPRSQSSSTVEQYFLSHSPPPSFSSHMRDLRFPFDSSNSTTPKAVRV